MWLVDLTLREEQQVERLATFIGVFHSQAFLRSSLASAAPTDDLKLISAMNAYLKIDLIVAEAALASWKRHLWYLTEECVILALFNENNSEELRTAMALKLQSIPRPNIFKPGKPEFPELDLDDEEGLDELSEIESIVSFLGPKSWLIFDLLGLKQEQEWMKLPPHYWSIGD